MTRRPDDHAPAVPPADGFPRASLRQTVHRSNRAEETIHRAICAFLDLALPEDAAYFHPANGGSRNAIEAKKLKAMGVKAGVFDLVIVWRGRVFMLEVKSPSGVLSAAQHRWGKTLDNCGVPHRVVRSVNEAAAALGAWGLVLRARVA